MGGSYQTEFQLARGSASAFLAELYSSGCLVQQPPAAGVPDTVLDVVSPPSSGGAFMLAFWPVSPDDTHIRCDLHWHRVRLPRDAHAAERAAARIQQIALRHGATVTSGAVFVPPSVSTGE
jgi:hypothetical protein